MSILMSYAEWGGVDFEKSGTNHSSKSKFRTFQLEKNLGPFGLRKVLQKLIMNSCPFGFITLALSTRQGSSTLKYSFYFLMCGSQEHHHHKLSNQSCHLANGRALFDILLMFVLCWYLLFAEQYRV